MCTGRPGHMDLLAVARLCLVLEWTTTLESGRCLRDAIAGMPPVSLRPVIAIPPPPARSEFLWIDSTGGGTVRLSVRACRPPFLDATSREWEGHSTVHRLQLPSHLVRNERCATRSRLKHTELCVSCLLSPCHRGSDPSVVRSTSPASDLRARQRVRVRDRGLLVRRPACQTG